MKSKWGWQQEKKSELEISITPIEIFDDYQPEIKNDHDNEIKDDNKYLVYYTIGGDIKFIESLELSIKSLRLFGGYTGDILIITDNICHEQVKERFADCKILNINSDCIHCESSINKLKIYTYENITNYNKIIYLDLDILIQNNINVIFDHIKDKFIFSNEYHPDSKRLQKINDLDGYGRLLFSNEESLLYDIQNKNAINSGFFGFDISMLHHFEKILIDLEIDREMSKNYDIWYCEQATLNKYMIVNDLYDDSVTDKILQFAKNYNYNDQNVKNKVLLHFCGGVGDHKGKIQFMQDWYDFLLKKNIHIEK